MDPRELKSDEQWIEILRELSSETGMAATLTDAQGGILLEEGDRYELCRRIRQQIESRTFVCSQANTAMLAMVKRTLKPIVDECDAGLLRIAVPIVQEGVLIGQVVACGLRGDDVDAFLVSKQLGISEEEAEALAAMSTIGDEVTLEEIAERLATKIS